MHEDYPINELTCGSDNNLNYHPPVASIKDYSHGESHYGELPPEYLTTGGRQKKLGARGINSQTTKSL